MRSCRKRAPIAPRPRSGDGRTRPSRFSIARWRAHSSPRTLRRKRARLSKLHILGGVKPILAVGAVRTGEAEALPGADHRRRNAHQAGHISDFQVRFGAVRLHALTACSPCDFASDAESYFSLDSSADGSLTLRDYSKVCVPAQAGLFANRKLPLAPRRSPCGRRSTPSTRVLVCLVRVLSASTLLIAQSTGGRILGRVADPTGAVLAGVKVTLINRGHRRVSRDSHDQRQRRLQLRRSDPGDLSRWNSN